MMKCLPVGARTQTGGIAALQASPTAMPRQAIFLNIKNDRIPYFDIHYSLFDLSACNAQADILRFKTCL